LPYEWYSQHVPKPATDRRLLTTTKVATGALTDELRALERVEARDGTDYWHVRILDWEGDLQGSSAAARERRAPSNRSRHGDRRPPFIAVEFIIGRHDPGYSIAKWSISGYELLSTRASRFPLQTYARAAMLAVEDAIAAEGQPGSHRYLWDELPYIGYPRTPEHGYIYREYRVVKGQVTDPRLARKPRPRPQRHYVTARSDEFHDRVSRAVDEYRRALEHGSRSPTADVARALNVGRSTAARALSEAREQGLLGPALRNRAGERR
jgi:hypothetical protein